ncbi:DsbC family protein [Modicisalibacter sp. 'Wilcox']|uniref:DsbC family protein n=1 Tax=Modicisalibacter sp. 'Wilcox' TaxID=2679914 RepID=UPI001F095CD3|nr:DsbC family protein [Modicisalibacter sp. 'Wilcox']
MQRMTRILSCLFLSGLMLAGVARAAVPEALTDTFTVNGKPVPVKTVSETPLKGLYEVRLTTGETLYSDAEGEYFVAGELYANRDEGLVNLTRQAENAERDKRLAAIPESQRVIFRGTDEPKAVLRVFTDVTCPYCRKLHEAVPTLNRMGIAVEYLAFPRSGLGSAGARQMVQVWCADNRQETLTDAMHGKAPTNPPDCDNPVADQYHLGLELGVQGTPAIVLPDGRLVPGYVPPRRLAAMLGLDPAG